MCLLALFPAVYQTVKTLLISAGNQEETFRIIGQMEWFDLINETLQAFLIVPLYSILNKIVQEAAIESERPPKKEYVREPLSGGNGEKAAHRCFRQKRTDRFAGAVFKTGLLVFILYTLFSMGVFLYGKTLIRAMNADGIELSAVSRYLYLETAAFIAGIVVSFVNVVFVVTERYKNVYTFLIVRILLSLAADLILIPRLSVYGAAVSNIVVNTALAVTGIALLYVQQDIKPCRFKRSDFTVVKEWCRTGFFSGSQQFLDNFIYAVMVCRMVNAVEEQGNYWIANNFIWGWLLIPITALAEVIRADCKNGYTKLNRFSYSFIVCASIAAWALSIPVWEPFYRYAENLTHAHEIFTITIKLAPFYIAYAGSAIIDNIFIGLGKTAYGMVNSLIVNFVYYAVFYVLYLTHSVVFDMNTIILMFGFGMVFHFLISAAEEKIFQKREQVT